MRGAPLSRTSYRFSSFAASLVFSFFFAVPCFGGELRGLVVGVTDGDTLIVLVDGERTRVRLTDIDAPERGQPYGNRSRQSLADLCHQRVAMVTAAGKDRYGRTLGTVSCDGVVANREQVRRGLAWVYTRYARRDSPLYALQSEARTQARGLWQMREPTPPWEWRSRRRAAHAGTPA
jgi:endonuclease YncB( thermonuclease family)